jgi:hypothetical protein
MKKTVYRLVLAVLVLVVESCLNATLDEPAALHNSVEEDSGEDVYDDGGNGDENDNGGNDDGDGGNQGVITAKSFRVDAVAGMSTVSDETKAGGRVAGLTVPVKDGPWTIELDPEYYNNALFTVTDDTDEPDDTGNVERYEVVVADGVTLGAGFYQISMRIYNDAGTEYFKSIEFQVLKTPAPFKRAPLVYPYIITAETDKVPGKNKLNVLWDGVSGAKGYRVYVGTDPDERPETPYETITDITATSQEITDIEGDSLEGGLPTSTTYYVWIGAFNGSGETLSPPAKRRTTEPVDPRFVGGWNCGYGDRYGITYDKVAYTVTYASDGAGTFEGTIVYHSIWSENYPIIHPSLGTKYGEDLSRPSGVYVIKYREEDSAAKQAIKAKGPGHIYSAVYYWGWRKPSRWVHMANQWNSYAERASPEEAIDYFTFENIGKFIKMNPAPYY